jgi:phosphate transport system substrate-binding protein
MNKFFTGMADALEKARRRPEITVTGTDSETADLAEVTPGSLTTMTYLQVVTEKRQLQLLPIDAVVPTLENFENGKYPYSKPIYLVGRRQPAGASERFLDFLGAAEAQRIIRQAGLTPLGND